MSRRSKWKNLTKMKMNSSTNQFLLIFIQIHNLVLCISCHGHFYQESPKFLILVRVKLGNDGMHNEDVGEVAIGAEMDIVESLQPDAISPLEPHVPSIHACSNSNINGLKFPLLFVKHGSYVQNFIQPKLVLNDVTIEELTMLTNIRSNKGVKEVKKC